MGGRRHPHRVRRRCVLAGRRAGRVLELRSWAGRARTVVTSSWSDSWHHSDRGSTCTAIRFANRLTDDGIAQSMGSVGDSCGNALVENFFSTSKTELVYRKSWRTREDAENALFAYIDGWYNAQPLEKRLGWLSPDEYEARYHDRLQPEPDSSLSGSAGEPHTGCARRRGPI
ncbi:IS3 family transposase [Nocardia salmonicida]|uniref:IS3 family transposase n=1 Tax=Nocardia salmonicida TaxID=53431 RepID=UPI0033ED35E0